LQSQQQGISLLQSATFHIAKRYAPLVLKLVGKYIRPRQPNKTNNILPEAHQNKFLPT
jgi:hypothetical protein